MACIDVGEANVDIAGIGIVTAFAFQAVASWVVSAILELFLPDMLSHPKLRGARNARRSVFTLASLREEIHRVEHDISRLTERIAEKASSFKQLSTVLGALHEESREYVRQVAMNHAPRELPRRELQEDIQERSPRQEARKIVAEILYFSSDVQTLAGIALALIGIIREKSLSLYQFHLVYDTINLTSVSNCAALASASAVDTRELLPRLVLIAVFAVLYLAFAILFGVRLNQWDDKIPGRCYNTSHLASHDAQHPSVDKIYLGITCFYMFTVLMVAVLHALARYDADQHKGAVRPVIADSIFYPLVLGPYLGPSLLGKWADKEGLQSRTWYFVKIPVALWLANPILQIAMVQLPLHLYFIIRIRLSNEPLLSNGSDENQWGFGQIYALIMSAALVIECVKGYLRYGNAKRSFEQPNDDVPPAEDANGNHHGPPPTATGRDGGVADMAEQNEDMPREIHMLSKATTL